MKKMGHFYLGFKRSDPFFANKTSKRWFKSTKSVTKKHPLSVCLKIELDSSISERASELAKSEACRPKGGSHGKAVIVCAKGEHNQVHKKSNKKTLYECLFGRIEWTRTTDPHLIRVVL